MSVRNPRVKQKFGQRGVAMLEVLISVLLLAVGIIALVSFQAAMSKNTTEAQLRSEAAFLANQLIGQLWADPANLQRYVVAAGTCTNSADTCTNWADAVNALLPQGEADVDVNGNDVSITIRWALPGEERSQYRIDAMVVTN